MNTIRLSLVTSSMIKAIGHDPENNVLAVQFHSEGEPIYHYANVTAGDFADLRAAPSVGSHFARFIKGKHESTRVGDAPKTFVEMLHAIEISANEGQAELALAAIMRSPDYTAAEKADATRVFNQKYAVVVGD